MLRGRLICSIAVDGVWLILGWMVVQVGFLIAQEYFGSAFFLPKAVRIAFLSSLYTLTDRLSLLSGNTRNSTTTTSQSLLRMPKRLMNHWVTAQCAWSQSSPLALISAGWVHRRRRLWLYSTVSAKLVLIVLLPAPTSSIRYALST